MTVGTPHYMAPEQAMGRRIGPWTDLYSLGIVAYELSTGTVPFSGGEVPLAVLLRQIQEPVPDPRAQRPELDPELVAWVLALVEKEPERRPAGASAAWEALEPIVLRLAGPLWRREAGLPAAGTAGTTTVTPAPFATPTYETHRTPPPPEPRPAPTVTATRVRPTPPPEPAAPRRRRAPWLVAAVAAVAAAATAGVLLLNRDKPVPAVRAAATARATATATRPAPTATPKATATPTATATPAPTPAIGRAIALHDEPTDVIVYRDAVWVTTPETHAVRRVDPRTRDVKRIELEASADPRGIEAGLGALWVDSWTDAFTRIDAATGDWTTIYMPTKSKPGYGFVVGDGAAWALDRQHGILYTLDPATGKPNDDGLQLGGPAIDAVVTGGTVYVLLESKLLGKVDARTGAFYDSVRLPARPAGIERERSKLVVAFAGDRFATYDAGTLKRTKLFSMHQPWERAEVFGSELGPRRRPRAPVSRFDTRTGDLLGDPISFDSDPVAVNFEPSGRAWVGLRSGALVSVDVPRTSRRSPSREWRREVSGVAAARATTERRPTISVAVARAGHRRVEHLAAQEERGPAAGWATTIATGSSMPWPLWIEHA